MLVGSCPRRPRTRQPHRRRASSSCGRTTRARSPSFGRRTASSRPAACTWGCPRSPTSLPLGRGVAARRVELDELLDLPGGHHRTSSSGGTARIVFAVLDAARRSLSAGLVHPHLEAADGRWHALWGATLDEQVRDELDAIAHAAPAAAAEAFDGDTEAVRPRPLRLRGRRARAAGAAHRAAVPAAAGPAPSSAVERFLAALAAETPRSLRTPATRRSSGGSRPGSTSGLSRRSRAPWNPASGSTRRRRAHGGRAAVVLDALARGGRRPDGRPPGEPAPRRERTRRSRSCARATRGVALERRLATIAPILARAPASRSPAIRRAGPSSTTRQVRAFLREGAPAPGAARRPGAPAPGVGGDGEPHQRQPRRHDPGGPSSGILTRDGDRVLRLAARDRGRRADRGGARRARRLEGAADPPARTVAHAPARRGRARPAVPRAPGALGRRDRELARAAPGSRPTRRASSSATSDSTPRSTSCWPTRASAGTGRSRPRRACATTSSRSRSGATAGCACWATSGWAESSPTTWGSARRCRRSPRSSRSARTHARTSAPRSSSAR